MKRITGKLVSMGALLLLIPLLAACAKHPPIGDITSFYYRYTTGNMSNSGVVYRLVLKNGAYTAEIKPDGVPEEEAVWFDTDKAFAGDLKEILSEHGVGKWNGFDKRNKHVMDGNSFLLEIEMETGSISASGYMEWPKNYADFRQAVGNLFTQAMENAKATDPA